LIFLGSFREDLFRIRIYEHVYAYKAVKQDFIASDNLIGLMHKFTGMVNLVIGIMIEKNLTSRNSVSKETYHMLIEYNMPSYYYPEAINKAVALVKTYRKRLKKKQKATMPHVEKPMLATYYGFTYKKLTGDPRGLPNPVYRRGAIFHPAVEVSPSPSFVLGNLTL